MRLAPLTGLFGTNSSGKSSILQFLLMLKQTVESADRAQVLDLGVEGDERDYVELGTFRDIIHRNGSDLAAESVQWSMSWQLPHTAHVPFPESPDAVSMMTNRDHSAPLVVLFGFDQLRFSASVRQDETRPAPLIVDQSVYEVPDVNQADKNY